MKSVLAKAASAVNPAAAAAHVIAALPAIAKPKKKPLSPEGAALCGGDCGALLAITLHQTTAELAGKAGANWGSVHQAVFAHPMLGPIPLLGALATWRIPQPGDDLDAAVPFDPLRHCPAQTVPKRSITIGPPRSR